MKKILSLFVLLFAGIVLYAQTDGISYQAVIIDPNGQEIPGVDAEGNILPHATVSMRFTIIDSNNNEEYQEVHTTNTDQFGMINLIIGSIDPENFTKIEWDGTPKDLRVEIDFNGSGANYTEMSREALMFLPYAYHRNITAAGTLIVDDATTLNSSLTVDGPTNLNSSLDVNNSNTSNLTGPLNVDGHTDLNSSLTVDGMTNVNDSLNVNLQSPSYLSGTLTVEDTATFNGPALFNAPVEFVEITVNGPSYLNGQVAIDAVMPDGDTEYANYPLLVEGSQNGIAIKVNGSRTVDNNYVSFWDDDTGEMWGRIEGQTVGDLWADPEHIYETASLASDVAINTAETVIANVDIIVATADLGIAGFELLQAGVELTARGTATTVCGGLGACVTAPPPSMIVSGTANLVLKIANAVVVGANLALVIGNAVTADLNLAKTIADAAAYEAFVHANIGVTYQSGAGDYAEWLPRANPSDEFSPGDIVGVTNGFITKTTSGAQQVMAISTRPIVLGNMPQENEEANYEKVAFMGQVPVKVIGKVQPGDYILPHIIGNGYGVAVHPDKMKITDYKKIVGVAWSGSDGSELSYVNVAVGMNSNDMNKVILDQNDKIKDVENEMGQMQQQINQLTDLLAQLVPGFAEVRPAESESIALTQTTYEESNKTEASASNFEFNAHKEYYTPKATDIIYFDIPDQYIREGIELAKQNYLKSSDKSLEEHPFWKKMQEEPAYVDEVVLEVRTKLEDAFRTQIEIDRKLQSAPVQTVMK